MSPLFPKQTTPPPLENRPPKPDGLFSNGAAVWALVVVSLVLAALPLGLGKPGLPPNLKADEAAYYGMALSLAHDFDVEHSIEDSERFFEEYPYLRIRNLVLMTDDGWETALYGKPYLYPLMAAPFARLAGANGMVFLNALLLVMCCWLGAAYLARRLDPGLAVVVSVLFFLVSAAFSYVFWLQPEIFNLACVTLALYFGFDRERSLSGRTSPAPLALGARFASGSALALAAYGKPMFAALALALVLAPLLRRRLAPAIAWCAGFGLMMLLCVMGSLALTGHASAYLVKPRQGTTLCAPDQLPKDMVEQRRLVLEELAAAPPAGTETSDITGEAAETVAESPTGNAFTWLIRVPDVGLGEFFENAGYFLWGRHAGLFVYFPLSLMALWAFLRAGAQRRLEHWLLLLSLGVVAVYFLVWIGWNWQGGGGFVGNRYYVSVVSGFLFLIPVVRKRWLLLFSLLAGLLAGPLLISPLGTMVPEATMQAHTRNFPHRLLPLELSLRNVPGYHHQKAGPIRMTARKDVAVPQNEGLWLHAGAPIEILFRSPTPVDGFTFLVRSPAEGNRVEIEMGGDSEVLEFEEAGQSSRIELRPKVFKKRRQFGTDQWVYRLRLKADRGITKTWTRYRPRPSCQQFAYNPTEMDNLHVGAELVYLGSPERVASAPWSLSWGEVDAPDRVTPGEEFEVNAQVTNTSQMTWGAQLMEPAEPGDAGDGGMARVRWAYHWFKNSGEVLRYDGKRTELTVPVPSGETTTAKLSVLAPNEPGAYTLELDPVYEFVGWFSAEGGNTVRRTVVVAEEP